MNEKIKIGDEVVLNEMFLYVPSDEKIKVIEITEKQYILSNGWSVQKDWVIKK